MRCSDELNYLMCAATLRASRLLLTELLSSSAKWYTHTHISGSMGSWAPSVNIAKFALDTLSDMFRFRAVTPILRIFWFHSVFHLCSLCRYELRMLLNLLGVLLHLIFRIVSPPKKDIKES